MGRQIAHHKRIKDRGYTQHPCQIHGLKFHSIQAAAEMLGMAYRQVYHRLHSGYRGYRLLPYDGKMPRIDNVKKLKPHIYAEGRWYRSQHEAAEVLGVTQGTISNRIANPNFPNYYVRLPD